MQVKLLPSAAAPAVFTSRSDAKCGTSPDVFAPQVKESKTLAFKPLAEALASPGEFLLSDFSKMERPAQLHAGFQALDAFQARGSGLAVCSWLVFFCLWGEGMGSMRRRPEGSDVVAAVWKQATKLGYQL